MWKYALWDILLFLPQRVTEGTAQLPEKPLILLGWKESLATLCANFSKFYNFIEMQFQSTM
jgi:hypothetical protein